MRFVLLSLLLALNCLGQEFNGLGDLAAGRVVAAAGGGNTLLTSLAGYWTLDEASGTRSDSTANANNLTDSGSTSGAAGKINNGANFQFSGATHLSHTDNASLSLGANTDFTIACWVKMTSDPVFELGIITKSIDRSASDEFFLEYAGSVSSQFRFFVGNGTTSASVSASNFGTPGAGAWCFIVAWHDGTAHTLNIQVNNGTANTTSWSGGTHDTAAPFFTGSFNDNPNLCWNGLIDEVGYWKRDLTSGERTDLYNSGNGRTYSYFQ